ncbi:DNA polymerase III subunit beta [Afipia felis]|uniref:Beta sliding clamp n=2 Tax=Afipia felis TaxID=1035 RepID=A0A380WD36_AFIFE|nr:DNA polymerase III subunit beta [Afipia felis]EKS29284.1 DNA polymerase III, beta subunit [Afipia felis ATCC 53690]SUU77992.1 DNA polymerase III subunit beta [Afipia felis]SUU86057.1 DNA polymerase III subunit beta [Afipia felis]
MTLTIPRADLARTLTAVTKVTESRNTIAILGNVLLSATAGTLTVTGTDLDIEYSASTACEGELSTTVDAKRLSDIARRLVGDTVTLELRDGSLAVKSGRSRFTLPTLPVADFPRLDGGVFDAEFKVDLAALVAPVRFAMSSEQTRYYLCGVYLHEADGKLRAVATDGHRLAHNSVAHPEPTAPGVIIPSKTVGLIPHGVIDVGISKNKVRLATADTIIVSKLIDGTFPDYGRVIPAANDNVVTVSRDELSKSIARVSAVANERGKAAKFGIAGDNIAIDMRSDDGSAHEDVPASYSCEPIEIGFNSAYMTDVLAAVPGGEITIALADGQTPAIFRGTGDVLALCMPMRA